MSTNNIRLFLKAIANSIPSKNILKDALSRHAYGHDAGHYRLIPQVVIRLDNENELKAILAAANQFTISITFRAGGTSVSGQAITDSVLVVLSEKWRGYEILDQGEAICLQPGVLGAEANLYLAPFNRKIGPDPASISSAKIGGIAANNASGMCCGTVHNSYHTLKNIRILFADGALLDTKDQDCVSLFRKSHEKWLDTLKNMRKFLLADTELCAKIFRKYSIKNTMGYSLNAFLDFDDPIDILSHLMIGSEGTLGFISEITYRTVHNHPFKKAALFFFKNIRKATEAVQLLRKSEAAAIELLDGLSIECAKSRLSDYLPMGFDLAHAALLVDVRADCPDALNSMAEDICHKLSLYDGLYHQTPFVDGKEYHQIWYMREGSFALIATMRRPGTLVLLEDFAVPLEFLPDAVDDLKALFKRLGFEKSSLFGHARDGNLHFVMEVRFDVEDELKRYEKLISELAEIVVKRYQGSLKAEHGTGRNMAPFVEYEWGKEAFALMWELKHLLDPNSVLNKDVLLSHDVAIHTKNLKCMPEVDELLDKCIECGYCEKVCPSRDLTLTPRQRIVSIRSMEMLKHTDHREYQQLLKDFDYSGAKTCAATGMCGEVCPVGINTGRAIQNWRAKHLSLTKRHFLGLTARYQDLFLKLSSLTLKVFRKTLPKPYTHQQSLHKTDHAKKIVLYPSCGCRMLDEVGKKDSITQLIKEILETLGYSVIYPNFKQECCGLMYSSKGATEIAQAKRQSLFQSLAKTSEQGKWPIITENVSCALELYDQQFSFVVHDAVHFIAQELKNYPLTQLDRTIMLHVNCSVSRLKEKDAIIELSKRCAKEVIVPPDIYCCGFAGSKGFTTPELNANALKTLQSQVPENCKEGYTCLQTCQIGLSKHSGIPYFSVLCLVKESMNTALGR